VPAEACTVSISIDRVALPTEEPIEAPPAPVLVRGDLVHELKRSHPPLPLLPRRIGSEVGPPTVNSRAVAS
jgi:hypothetical protein